MLATAFPAPQGKVHSCQSLCRQICSKDLKKGVYCSFTFAFTHAKTLGKYVSFKKKKNKLNAIYVQQWNIHMRGMN